MKKSTASLSPAVLFNSVAACAALSLLIAGCPGVVQPTPTPTASPTPTPTASPTPTPTASPTPTPTPQPRLYIANLGNNVTSYNDPASVNGNIAPDANLAGAQTQLNLTTDIVVNSAQQLIACNFGTPSITSYDNAPVNGNVAPSGNIQGAATLITQPNSIAINTDQDLLFLADDANDDILVFQGTAQASFNGNLAPVRTIDSADIVKPFGINFGANDDLYVANNNANNVAVFANASTLNGTVNATRIITSAAFTDLFDVYVDPDDTMFVVDNNGMIFSFSNASTRNGNVDPDFTLTVPGATDLTAIAVDSVGTGYVVERTANTIFSYDNIGTLNGTVNPDRTIQGANTQLNSPIRVFLTE